MSNQQSLIKFNIQNAKFAVATADGYGAITPFASSIKMALEGDISSKDIYGDGQVIATLVNDKGKKGVLTSNNITNAYEIAMGRKMETSEGLSDIKQNTIIKHAIYFETCELLGDGTKTSVAKTWLFNCTSTSRPSEAYDQTTEDINQSTFENSFVVHGVAVQTAAGTANYKDENGNEVIAWQVTKVPGDEGYETFESSVPTPKMKA